jgi:hypothetical protein
LHLPTDVVLSIIGELEGVCYERGHEIVAVDHSIIPVFYKLACHWQRGASEVGEHHGPYEHERVFLIAHHFGLARGKGVVARGNFVVIISDFFQAIKKDSVLSELNSVHTQALQSNGVICVFVVWIGG